MRDFIKYVATIEIPVSNLVKSVEFYERIIGLRVESKGESWAMLTFGVKHVPTIYLVQTNKVNPLQFRNSNTDITHSIIDFYTPHLHDYYNWLKENDVEVGELNSNPENGLGGFGFKDPDGNLLSACNIEHN